MQLPLGAIDESTCYGLTTGDREQRARFTALLHDLIARGRSVSVIVPYEVPAKSRASTAWARSGRG